VAGATPDGILRYLTKYRFWAIWVFEQFTATTRFGALPMTQAPLMAQTLPMSETLSMWHSSQGRFAHSHPKCPIGRYVAPHQRIAGSGGRRLCRECERLARAVPVLVNGK
jgi:hypothetical protein